MDDQLFLYQENKIMGVGVWKPTLQWYSILSHAIRFPVKRMQDLGQKDHFRCRVIKYTPAKYSTMTWKT